MRNALASPAAKIGARVRGLMAERKITQERVADHLGLKQPAIARRLSGEVPFDVNELSQVAGLLDVQVSTLTEVSL